ncbi:hypothetical protein BZA77DRAFT_307224 [Pyronema omphalodes]|nr:hypothetical protein BZA77DRAFT_307224 [Pyronema omphalodes]
MSKRIDDEDDDLSSDLSELSEEEEEDEEDQEYLVDKLLADKFCPVRKQRVYLVLWEGYPIESATWEPVSSFSDDQNHIIKDYERQKEEGEINFDWQKWDRDREREAQEAEENRLKEKALKKKEKQKRAEMRKRQEVLKIFKDSTAVRKTRKPSPSLKGFVVDDDSGLEEVSDSELQDLDRDSRLTARRARKKNKDRDTKLRVENDNDYKNTDSDDSLVSSIKKKTKPSKAKDNSKGQSRPGEQSITKGSLKKKGNTRPGPANKTKKIMTGTSLQKTTIPSKRRHSLKSPSPPLPRPRKRSTATANSDPDSFTADVKAPPAEQLNLVKVGGSRPATNSSIADIHPQSTSGASRGNGSAMETVSSTKRKQTSLQGEINTAVSAQSDQVSESNLFPEVENGTPNDQLAPPTKRHRSEVYQLPRSNISREDTPSRLLEEELFGSDPFSPTPSHGFPVSSEASNSIENPRLADPIFECELLYGPSASTAASLGKVKFLGLSNDFLVMMSELQPEKLWISRSLDTWFLLHYFLPEYRLPEEYGDIECEAPTRFIDACSAFGGVGVIPHEKFTMMIFPTMRDDLRSPFHLPQQRIQTELRFVLYPPLDLDIPDPIPEESVFHKAYDEGFNHYLPYLLSSCVGYTNLLREKPNKDNDNYILFYCPEIAKAERIELEKALNLVGYKSNATDVQILSMSRSSEHRKKMLVTVLVHVSLRGQLHLLPQQVNQLVKWANVRFQFFGSALQLSLDSDERILKTVEDPFWLFGTLILLTPKFLANNSVGIEKMIDYWHFKSFSTTLCVPIQTILRVEKFIVNRVTDKAEAERHLRALYRLADLIAKGHALELPIFSTKRELEPGELDIDDTPSLSNAPPSIYDIVDQFLYFQSDEKAQQYRKFGIVHSHQEAVQLRKIKDLLPQMDLVSPDLIDRSYPVKLSQPPTK